MIVYCINNLINGKKYVGQTIHSIDSRWKEHVRCSQRNPKYPIHCAIKKYSPRSFEFYVLQECNTKEELDIAEISWIKKINSRICGYNLAKGGAGVRGKGLWNHTDEAKLAISRGNIGKVRSLELRKRISNSVRKSMTPTLKDLISKNTIKALSNPITRLKLEKNNYSKTRKIVAQYSLNDELITTYDSATIAARLSGVNKGNLCACARGCFKQAGGFRWKYISKDRSS